MITVSIKPRQDDLFDIWVTGANGEVLLNSSQGYENARDAELIARKLFGQGNSDVPVDLHRRAEPIELTIAYRDGTSFVEQLR